MLLNLTLQRAFNDTGLILLTDWASRYKQGRIQHSAVWKTAQREDFWPRTKPRLSIGSCALLILFSIRFYHLAPNGFSTLGNLISAKQSWAEPRISRRSSGRTARSAVEQQDACLDMHTYKRHSTCNDWNSIQLNIFVFKKLACCFESSYSRSIQWFTHKHSYLILNELVVLNKLV